MKVQLTIAAAFLALTAGASYGFPLTFTETLCTMEDQPLSDNVSEFEGRLTKVKRLEARGSAHRKHVEQHATELLSALNAATDDAKCPTERKQQLEQIKAQIADI